MRKQLVKYSFLFLFIAPYFSFSQTLSKAEFKQYFTQGNLMILEHYYDTALTTFLLLNHADPSNANVNYKIGTCYLNIPGKKAQAIPYFENAIKQSKGNYIEDDPSEKNAPETAIMNLGQAYHYAYRFDEAIVQFQKFKDMIGKWNTGLVKDLDRCIETSKNAKQLTEKPIDCILVNLGDSVNCEFADYSPVISADESMLVFTSRRFNAQTGGNDNKTIDDKYLEDLWISYPSKYGTWTKAKPISRTINTESNEASIGISADGQQLYVYRDDNGDGNIYVSKLDGDFWTAPFKLDASNINTKSWEPSACISADGNTMYFVSNRGGGFGGRDIYQCHRLPNRSWSEPENLGSTINTPYDEDAPFIHPDGVTFFFSSTGHNSMGGFDIFYSTKVAENVWAKPINIGFPINTTDDDIYFVTSSDGRRAYYSSFRPEGKGEKDLYMVSMANPIAKSIAILVGYIKNRDGSPIPQLTFLTAMGANGETIVCKPNAATGKFIQSLLPGQQYTITIEANNKKVFSEKFYLPEDSTYQKLSRGFFQKTIFLGDTTPIFANAKDTTSRTKLVEMEGRILHSQNLLDVAPNVTLHLLTEQGSVIQSVITDKRGKFKFENIPSDKKFLIKIDENDSVLKSDSTLFLANATDKIIASSSNEGRFFIFKNIPSDLNSVAPIDMKDSAPIPAKMEGRISLSNDGKKSGSNINLNLLDENGKTIQSAKTDNTGRFTFANIPGDKNYALSIKENDLVLKNKQDIYLLNKKDDIIKRISKLADYFVFQNLPADLNKLSALDMIDTTQFIAMKGKILKSNNPQDGIANLKINLIDSKGISIQTTMTDPAGSFVFQRLSSNTNYTVRLDDNTALLASVKKVYLANEADKIVKVIDVVKNKSFKNLPADLMQMQEIKEETITTAKEESKIIEKELKYPGDERFDFVIYFTYNRKDIDIAVASYLSMIEKINKSITENGKATITILASSSTVPTKTYNDNESLSKMRGNEVKDKIHASVSWKNIDEEKITYQIDAKVQGPEYKGDAILHKNEYEKWQYVKVIVK